MDNNTSTDFENDDSSTVPASPLIFHEGYIEEPNYDLSFSLMNNNSFVSNNDGEEYEERNISGRDKDKDRGTDRDDKKMASPVKSPSNSRRESLQSYRGMSYNSVHSNNNSNEVYKSLRHRKSQVSLFDKSLTLPDFRNSATSTTSVTRENVQTATQPSNALYDSSRRSSSIKMGKEIGNREVNTTTHSLSIDQEPQPQQQQQNQGIGNNVRSKSITPTLKFFNTDNDDDDINEGQNLDSSGVISDGVSEEDTAAKHEEIERMLDRILHEDDNISVRQNDNFGYFNDTRSLYPRTIIGDDSESTITSASTSTNATKMTSNTYNIFTSNNINNNNNSNRVYRSAYENYELERADNDSDSNKFFNHKKQFFILSSAGKPIYSLHGSDDILTVYSGIIQTIVSFFEFGNKNGKSERLKSIVCGKNKFLFLNKSPILLMTISLLNESDIELNQQLDFLYNFLLSTLSKPHIEKVFMRRDNFDLRKLLGRSDIACLDSICEDLSNFNNPGLIIGGLECLKLKYPTRHKLEKILLNNRSNNLLYGLLVGPEGKLITILRPQNHTLHTSDLQLLFSMIFKTNTFKTSSTSSGENNEVNDHFITSDEEFWVPLCLPKFNPNGFLYCYIKFFDLLNDEIMEKFGINKINKETIFNFDFSKISVILISAYKDSFFEMKKLGNNIIESINNSRSIYRELYKSIVGTQGSNGTTGLPSGRISTIDIPAPLIRHFIFKGKKNIQYVFPRINYYNYNYIDSNVNNNNNNNFNDEDDKVIKGQLMKLYSSLHSKLVINMLNFGAVNNKNARGKVSNEGNGNKSSDQLIGDFSIDSNGNFIIFERFKINEGKDSLIGIVISTPTYEIYAINNGGYIDKNIIINSCRKIIKWCLKNESKLFVSGGAIF
ncbi:hypothetical protein B5S30_g3156 [[Candida] boidinii]|nr:hypothetical protein B5S30_g3156 [[Candida] boidinii]GMG19436.1 unnamed protein product [[Candida] boidinii]